jgi:hypothetical protein
MPDISHLTAWEVVSPNVTEVLNEFRRRLHIFGRDYHLFALKDRQDWRLFVAHHAFTDAGPDFQHPDDWLIIVTLRQEGEKFWLDISYKGILFSCFFLQP